MTARDDKRDQDEPYFIEVDQNGCAHCGSNRFWTVVGPDGVALGHSWGEEEAASDVADWMNQAYHAGKASALSNEQNNALSAPSSEYRLSKSEEAASRPAESTLSHVGPKADWLTRKLAEAPEPEHAGPLAYAPSTTARSGDTPITDAAGLWLMAQGPLPADWKCPPGQEADIRQFDHELLGPCTEWKVVTAAVARRLERELAESERKLDLAAESYGQAHGRAAEMAASLRAESAASATLCSPEELKRLREVEHAAWHLLDDSETNGTSGEVTVLQSTFEALSSLLPESHPEESAAIAPTDREENLAVMVRRLASKVGQLSTGPQEIVTQAMGLLDRYSLQGSTLRRADDGKQT